MKTLNFILIGIIIILGSVLIITLYQNQTIHDELQLDHKLKSVELKPRVISYLIGVNNLTARRIEFMNNNGYYLAKIKMLKVYQLLKKYLLIGM